MSASRAALPLLVSCLVAACGGDPADSASASDAGGTGSATDASAGTASSAASEDPTNTPTSGDADTSATAGGDTDAASAGATTTTADTAPPDTTPPDTTPGTTEPDATTADTTADATTADTTADATTADTTADATTGGVTTDDVDPWDCDGGDPITVNGEGKYATLAAAVAAAPPQATITVCAGTYVETVIVDRPLTLLGAGQDVTVLDGGGAGTQLYIQGVSVTIEGFTFTHGEAEHNPLGNSKCGGAIAIDYGVGAMDVKISDCTFNDNHGEYGGAICFDGGDNDPMLHKLFLADVLLDGNSADVNGGAVFSYSDTYLTDTTITHNTAGNQGGGLYLSYNDNAITGGAVKQNTADEGGGMFLQSPVHVDVTNSDWGFGMAQENAPNDVQHYANAYGFFGADVSFLCEYIVWNMGMCALK